MSVNRPTNVKQKEADVNQKLQLYGIYSGKSNYIIIKFHQSSTPTTWSFRACGNWSVISSAEEQMANLQR